MIVGFQEWRDLLFVHFRVDARRLRPLVHPRLDLDLYEGSAWVSMTPFTLRRGRLRGLPPLPDFHELNLRTYVTLGGKDPGIWFFSLDAESWAAVLAARLSIRLPYFPARMSRGRDPDGSQWYRSDRLVGRAKFSAAWTVGAEIGTAAPGSLEAFLVERYVLWSRAAGPVLFRDRVHHPPWVLRAAVLQRLEQTLTDAAGIGGMDGDPLCHFSDMPLVGFEMVSVR